MEQPSSFQYRAPQSYPLKLYAKSTSAEKFSNRHEPPPLEYGADLERSLLSSGEDSVFLGPFAWNADCGINNLSNGNFCTWSQVEHDRSPMRWGPISPRQELWGPPMEMHSLTGAVSPLRSGLHSNANFTRSASSLHNSEDENFNTPTDRFFNAEAGYGGMEEIEFMNLLQENALLYNQGLLDCSPPNVTSSHLLPGNEGSDSLLLGQIFSSSQRHDSNDTIQASGYRDPIVSVSGMPLSSVSSDTSSYQGIDHAFQLGFFDDLAKSFAVTYLPPIAAAPSTLRSLPLPPREEPSRAFAEGYSPGIASMQHGNSSFSRDPMTHDKIRELKELHLRQSFQLGMSENENSLNATKLVPAIGRVKVGESTHWQNMSSTESTPHEEIKDFKQSRRTGRRRGQLKPETARNARVMRHMKACLPCVILKMKCTPGDICKRCSGLSSPTLGKRICIRAHLEDLRDLFFPVPFVSHLQPESVDMLSRELSLGFVGTDFKVDFTCGYGYLPIRLTVSEFSPRSDLLTRIPTIATRPTDGATSFEYQNPPPLAFRSTGIDLVEGCRKHIQQVVTRERNAPGTTLQTGHKISQLVFKAITRYHGSSSSSRNIPMLDKAMMLRATYYFMATTLTITDESKGYVENRLRKPAGQSYDSKLISRLLNRQVKSAMHTLRCQLMREVLKELEKELKTRTKAVWAPCFCVVLIICMCIEEAQTAMDAFAMHTRVHGAEENDTPSSQDTVESCRKLDELLFQHLLELFHRIYKSRQLPKKCNASRVYNPIRDGPEIDVQEGLDGRSADLVTEIRQIMASHGERKHRRFYSGEAFELANVSEKVKLWTG